MEVPWNGRSLLLDDQNRPEEDRDLPGGVTNDPGTSLLLRHAAPGSDLPPLADGANDCTCLKQESLDKPRFPATRSLQIKEAPTASLDSLISGPQYRKSRPPHPGCTLSKRKRVKTVAKIKVILLPNKKEYQRICLVAGA